MFLTILCNPSFRLVCATIRTNLFNIHTLNSISPTHLFHLPVVPPYSSLQFIFRLYHHLMTFSHAANINSILSLITSQPMPPHLSIHHLSFPPLHRTLPTFPHSTLSTFLPTPACCQLPNPIPNHISPSPLHHRLTYPSPLHSIDPPHSSGRSTSFPIFSLKLSALFLQGSALHPAHSIL